MVKTCASSKRNQLEYKSKDINGEKYCMRSPFEKYIATTMAEEAIGIMVPVSRKEAQ